ncbi:MAG: hypothetical protein IJ733_10720 [Lachnospiraceae bacterium]|nr:hypothetical protein [Lachnospiraceae bacterium]
MVFLLNDYSLDGQFDDIEEFLNLVNEELKFIFDYFIEYQIPLYKKSDFYSRNVTKKITLQNVLHISGDPLVYQIKKYFIEMAYQEPYWDVVPETVMEFVYRCQNDEEIPNCFTEAIERQGVILSIKHKDFMNPNFVFWRNDVQGSLDNIVTYRCFLEWLIGQEDSDKKYIFENYPFSQRVIFPVIREIEEGFE